MPLHGKIVVIKRSGGDGTEFPLTASCMFGRKPDCDIRIQLPQVSKEHCRIDLNENKEVILTNLSSVNPTRINGNTLQQSERLKHGDVITIIDRSFRFEYPPAPTPKKRSSTGGKTETLKVLQDQQVIDPVSVETGEKKISDVFIDGHNHDNVQKSTEKTLEVDSKGDATQPENKTNSPFNDLYQMIKKSLDVKTPRKSSVSVAQTPASKFCTPKPVSVRKSDVKSVVLEEDKATSKIENEVEVVPGAEAKEQDKSSATVIPKSVKKQRRSSVTPGPAVTEAANMSETPSPRRRVRVNLERFTAAQVIDLVGTQTPKSPVRRRSKENTPNKAAATPLSPEPVQRRSPRNLEKAEKVKEVTKKRKCGELADDLPTSNMKRKRVSFGGYLSPELFDKRLPPDSPLRKGATPRRSLSLYKPKLSLIRRASVCGLPTGSSKTSSPKKSPICKKASPKTATPGKKSPNSKSASPKAATPEKKSPTSTSSSPKTTTSAKKSPNSRPASPKAATPAKKSPKSRSASPKAETPKSSQKSRSPSPKAATPGTKLLKTPSSARGTSPSTPSVQGRFSVLRVSTPSPIPKDSVPDQMPLVTPKIPLKRKSMKSISRKTPLLSKSVAKIMRRSGISRASMKVKYSFADIVKFGQTKAPAAKMAVTKKTTKKTVAKQQTPARRLKDHVGTGHADSPATIFVGRAHKLNVLQPCAAPKVVANIAVLKKNMKMDEDLTGLPEMFKTPMNEKKRSVIEKSVTETPGGAIGTSLVEPSVLNTPEGPGEMMVSPLNVASTVKDKSYCEAVQRLLNENQDSSFDGEIPPLETPSDKTIEQPCSDVKTSPVKTPKQKPEKPDCLRITRTSKQIAEPIEDLRGRLLKTPKQKPVQQECLTGVKMIMKTPKQKTEPIEDLRGKMLKTPKQKPEKQECLTGVKRIMRTPRQKAEPVEDLRGKPLVTPKQKLEQQECLTGVKKIFQTPQQEVELSGDLPGNLEASEESPCAAKEAVDQTSSECAVSQTDDAIKELDFVQEVPQEEEKQPDVLNATPDRAKGDDSQESSDAMETISVAAVDESLSEEQPLIDTAIKNLPEEEVQVAVVVENLPEEQPEVELASENLPEKQSESEVAVENLPEEQQEVEPVVEDSTDEQPEVEPVVEDSTEEQPELEPVVEDSTEEQPEVEPVVEDSTEEQPEVEPVVEDSTEEQPEVEPVVETLSEEQPAAELAENLPDEQPEVEPVVEDSTEEQSEVEPVVEDSTEEQSEVEPVVEDSTEEQSEVEPVVEDSTEEQPEVEPVVEDSTEEQPEVEPVVEDSTEEQPEVEPVVEDSTEEQPEVEPVVEDSTEEQPEVEPVVEDSTKEQPEVGPVVESLTKEQPAVELAENLPDEQPEVEPVVDNHLEKQPDMEAVIENPTVTQPEAPETTTVEVTETDRAAVAPVQERKPIRGQRAKALQPEVEEDKPEDPSEEPVAPVQARGRRGKKTETTASTVVRQTTRNRKANSIESKDVDLIVEETAPQPPKAAVKSRRGRYAKKAEEPAEIVQEIAPEPDITPEAQTEQTPSVDVDHKANESKVPQVKPAPKTRRGRRAKEEPDVPQPPCDKVSQAHVDKDVNDTCSEHLDTVPSKNEEHKSSDIKETVTDAPATEIPPEVQADKSSDTEKTLPQASVTESSTEADAEMEAVIVQKKPVRGRRAKIVESKTTEDKQEAKEQSEDPVISAPVRGRRGKKTLVPAAFPVGQTRTRNAKVQENTCHAKPEIVPEESVEAKPVAEIPSESISDQTPPLSTTQEVNDSSPPAEEAVAKPTRGRKAKRAAVEVPQPEQEKNEVSQEPLVAEPQPPTTTTAKPRGGRKTKADTIEQLETAEDVKDEVVAVETLSPVRAKRGRKTKLEENRIETDSIEARGPAKKSRRTRKTEEDEVKPREEEEIQSEIIPEEAEVVPIAEPVEINKPVLETAKPRRGGRRAKQPTESETPAETTEVEEVSAVKPKRGRRGKEVTQEAEVSAEASEVNCCLVDEAEEKTAEPEAPAVKASRGRGTKTVKTEVSQVVPAKRARRGAAPPVEDTNTESTVQDSSAVLAVEPVKRGRRAAAMSNDQLNPSDVAEDAKVSKLPARWNLELEVIQIPVVTPVKATRGRKFKKPEEKDLSEEVDALPVKRARRGAKAAEVTVEPQDTEAEMQPKTRRGRSAKK